MQLEPDTIVANKLRLLRPLGQGGMGVVWAARHLALETDVAVKFIRPERVAADPALVARFEREARATARIAHPHVVQVMDYGTVDNAVPYIVMELLQGASLAELLDRGGRLSFATAKSLAQQVASALESAHEHGVVHRDIKPHNIFLTQGSNGYPLFVKVLDFGVAKVLGDTQVPALSPSLTETGAVIGSPPYMSPEQLEGSKDVDLRSDLWSLGVIMYETLTGSQPFQGSSFVKVGAAILDGKYRPASELRPNLPAGIDDWFAKALCRDVEGRFQSAREMADALVALDAAADAPPDATEEAADEAPPARYGANVEAPLELEGLSGGSHQEGDAPLDEGPATEPPDAGGGTVRHAPLAKKPQRPEARGSGPAGRLRKGLLLAAAALATATGLGLAALPRRAGSAGCPPGMALIEGAEFKIGSDDHAETLLDETPRRGVAVGPFCLDITEVTVKAYGECEGCERPQRTVEAEAVTLNGRSFYSQFCNGPEAKDHPINCIDWNQAKAYCRALGKRLPTEAEWELAARGRDARPYPWPDLGPPLGKRLNACGSECSRMLTEGHKTVLKGEWPKMYEDDDSAPATSPVGRYPEGATPAGVLDLAGNVWEWTESPYCPYDKPDCGDSRRVLRGGGWDTVESQDVRAARRKPSPPTARGWSIGFRCAKTP